VRKEVITKIANENQSIDLLNRIVSKATGVNDMNVDHCGRTLP